MDTTIKILEKAFDLAMGLVPIHIRAVLIMIKALVLGNLKNAEPETITAFGEVKAPEDLRNALQNLLNSFRGYFGFSSWVAAIYDSAVQLLCNGLLNALWDAIIADAVVTPAFGVSIIRGESNETANTKYAAALIEVCTKE